jgi:hypothetical protein
MTSKGVVLAIVEGSVAGVTNSDLTHLIRAGVAETYSIQCVAPSGVTPNDVRMYWYLVDNRQTGTALVKVHIEQDGKIIRSEFTNVTAPGIDPDVMFMDNISRFAQGVLPPPYKPVAASGQTKCP